MIFPPRSLAAVLLFIVLCPLASRGATAAPDGGPTRHAHRLEGALSWSF